MKRLTPFILIILISLLACNNVKDDSKYSNKKEPVRVELVENNGKYQLLINGEPYFIKGAGSEFEKIPILAESGANSCRTWSTEMPGYNAKEFLDRAFENGLTVTLGLDVKKERHGFDYNDPVAVKQQLEYLKKEVLKYKDHPALIIWGIGNELNLNYTNPKVWDAVNEISEMIHELDSNHLTTTMLAGINEAEIKHITERCPDIDLLSIQLYGDLHNLQSLIKKSGYNGPYMVTEWGSKGHWEVDKTEWGVAIEPTSKQKSESFIYAYNNGIKVDTNRCIGSYVFYWGQKQERTPTWYGLFTENGNPTETIDAMYYLWKGEWAEDRAPQLDSLKLNGLSSYESVKLNKSKSYPAEVFIHYHENDSLTYQWEIMYESTDLGVGGDHESRPESLHGLIKGTSNKIEMTTPDKKGAFRLFVYVSDKNGKVATANIPFYVI